MLCVCVCKWMNHSHCGLLVFRVLLVDFVWPLLLSGSVQWESLQAKAK